MNKKKDKVIRGFFLAIPITSIVVIFIIMILVFIMIKGELKLSDISNIYLRSPFILQGFINLIFLWILAFLGARLFDDKRPKTKQGNYSFSLLSLMMGILLHPMVYGIAWFLPVTYSLFGPYHKAMVIFTAPVGANPETFVNVIIHLFTPQVVLSLFISTIAFRRGFGEKT